MSICCRFREKWLCSANRHRNDNKILCFHCRFIVDSGRGAHPKPALVYNQSMARHVYIHIPFCAAKCPYCSFYSTIRVEPGFWAAAKKELKIYEELLGVRNDLGRTGGDDDIDTIYVGGGTPSVVDADKLCELVEETKKVYEIKEDAEITIEANPFSLTADKAIAYSKAGFNRISIGVQSLDDEVLKTLGRLHDRQKAIEAIETATDAGFTNISADLMIGIPGQSLEMIKRDADTLISLRVKHISMYSLTIEEGTPFYKRYSKTLEDLVPQEAERMMYHGLREHLAGCGFRPYEISNCAIEGYESRHNTMYWHGGEYYAIGAGSHGYLDSVRFAHPDDVALYVRSMADVGAEDYVRLLKGDCDDIGAIRALERLTLKDKMHEYAMLMLRTTDGIDRRIFSQKFGVDAGEVFECAIKENLARGWLETSGGRIRLTAEGLDFANAVFADFL